MKVFSAEFIDDLVQQAVASPRGRQHHNLHADFAETVQRTFIAIEPDSYVRPHRHGLTPRTETMLAVRGLMALLVFDDAGEVTQVVRFGAGQIGDAANAVGFRIIKNLGVDGHSHYPTAGSLRQSRD